MKTIRCMMALCAALAAAFVTQAATIPFPSASGDIASEGADGWNGTKPGESDYAQFAQAGGAYTASGNVTFGTITIGQNSTFTLGRGSPTVKASNFYIASSGRTATLNGGMWDFSIATSPNPNMPPQMIAPCNQNCINGTTLILAQGCIVTNAVEFRLAYVSHDNTFKITDGSRVYANRATLCNNSQSVNGLLEVSSGGVLTLLTGNFNDTAATKTANQILADTTNRVVITGAGSKIVNPSSGASQGFSIGNTYGCNSLLVSDGGELVAPLKFRIGASSNANGNLAVFDSATGTVNNVVLGENGSCGNTLIVSNSTFKCNRVIVSDNAAACSNAFYIAGSDTDFTVRVNNLPRYPFVKNGAYNVFEMSDGAEWNYFLNMQIDEAASSNTLRFVKGAHMNMQGGLFSGTNHIASCGNRVYVGSGARLDLSFLYISRSDNVVTVSNAIVNASGTQSSWNGLRFGQKLTNVEETAIGGNGLVVQGDTPEISTVGDVSFARGSFLRFAIPSGAYATGCIPLMARKLSLDDSSSLEMAYPQERVTPGAHTLVSTTGGITLPVATLAAANASLSGQSGGRAKLVLANGNNDLVLKVSRGFVVSFR